jgi:Fur family transcriptional regulator, peroxide stress response regulator
MSSFEYFTSSLKQAGMSLTPQRMAICKMLSGSNAHHTAASIYQQVRKQYPSLSLMTVYNTLNALVDLGAITALGDARDDNAHYDGNNSPHINLACISCHTIVDFDSQGIAELEGEASLASGFKILGARMLYYGLCPACQKLNNQKKRRKI